MCAGEPWQVWHDWQQRRQWSGGGRERPARPPGLQQGASSARHEVPPPVRPGQLERERRVGRWGEEVGRTIGFATHFVNLAHVWGRRRELNVVALLSNIIFIPCALTHFNDLHNMFWICVYPFHIYDIICVANDANNCWVYFAIVSLAYCHTSPLLNFSFGFNITTHSVYIFRKWLLIIILLCTLLCAWSRSYIYIYRA